MSEEPTGNPGWTFNGWNPGLMDTVTGNVTYTAQWTQNEYTIVYDPGTNGTWSAADETYTANYGDLRPPMDGEPTGNPGWKFNGWTPDLADTVTGSVTYTAQWTLDEYTIIYDPGTNGTWLAINETYISTYGATRPHMTGPLTGNPGWTFNGWSPALELSVTGSVIYIAQWTQNIYTIIYAPGTN
jgi:hypothetical protein